MELQASNRSHLRVELMQEPPRCQVPHLHFCLSQHERNSFVCFSSRCAAHPHTPVGRRRRQKPPVRRKAHVADAAAVALVRVQARAVAQVVQPETAVRRTRGGKLIEGVDIERQAGARAALANNLLSCAAHAPS